MEYVHFGGQVLQKEKIDNSQVASLSQRESCLSSISGRILRRLLFEDFFEWYSFSSDVQFCFASQSGLTHTQSAWVSASQKRRPKTSLVVFNRSVVFGMLTCNIPYNPSCIYQTKF